MKSKSIFSESVCTPCVDVCQSFGAGCENQRKLHDGILPRGEQIVASERVLQDELLHYSVSLVPLLPQFTIGSGNQAPASQHSHIQFGSNQLTLQDAST